jgi:MazG family protein
MSLSKNIDRLHEIIKTLRTPDGCPWDRKQTPESFKSYIIEETHELLEAIDQEEPNQIKEELGDMFFQLIFLGELYEEQGEFTISEAVQSITKKMIHRHPHVFGDEKLASDEDQRRRWNELKAKEKKKEKSVSDLVSGVPKSLPALRRAQRISERAAHNGFEWQNIEQLFDKLSEEIEEIRQAIAAKDPAAIQEEIGDLLFAMVNLGRLTNSNAEEALISATEKFTIRFKAVDRALQSKKQTIQETSAEDLLTLWQKVKNELT